MIVGNDTENGVDIADLIGLRVCASDGCGTLALIFICRHHRFRQISKVIALILAQMGDNSCFVVD